MLKVAKFQNIFRNCQKFIDVKGKILKIYVECEDIYPNIQLLVQTQEKETLYNSNLKERCVNIYPINIVEETQIMENEILGEVDYSISKRELMRDYFYSYGSLGFKFSGLEEGQKIKCVKVLYEGVEDNGSKTWNFG